MPAAPQPDAADTRKGVKSVEIAFQIVSVLEAADQPIGVGEIASLAGMQPSRIHHYLVSLTRAGMAVQGKDGRYGLGPYAMQVGLSAMRRLDYLDHCAAAARRFCDATGEATFVAVWGTYGPTIVRYFEGRQPVTVEAREGLVLPVVRSATGRVYLTWGGDARIRNVLDREQIDPAEIEQIRAATRDQSIGHVSGDLLPRIASLSAPIFNHREQLVAALTTLGWRGEIDDAVSGGLANTLKAEAIALSTEFGFREQP